MAGEGGQVGERGGAGLGEAVDHPVAGALARDEVVAAEEGEVFGDFDLGLAEDRLEVADAKRAGREEVQEAEPGGIGEAGVDANEIEHESVNMLRLAYSASGISAPAARNDG